MKNNLYLKNGVDTATGVIWGEKQCPAIAHDAHRNGMLARNDIRFKRESIENILSITAIFGDLLMIVLGFVLAVQLQFQSVLVSSNVGGVPIFSVSNSYKLIVWGSLIVFWGLLRRDLYTYKCLLSPHKSLSKFMAALGICLFTFIGVSLAIHTDPPISRRFIAGALCLIFFSVFSWRLLLSRIMQHPSLAAYLRRRLVVIGGGMQTRQIQKELGEASEMEFVGWIQANNPNHVAELEDYRLGSLHELGSLLHRNAVDIVVLTESESLQREGVLAVAKVCESEHVQFRMVPHFFEILVSGLRPDKIGETQVVGVEALPLKIYRNRVVKRTMDIAGAITGLMLSIPLILIFGALVYLESPGPIFYRQIRMGKNGRLFSMIKIRSMRINAEAPGKVQWAIPNDQRRLRIGALIRKWNIDEVPQFWNVLRGEMSLVGPRPERPELIESFKTKIPHYQVRHSCCPGMTGWAQVNGWRGNTDLKKRIYHDIWYVESWSLLLDIRIMFLTFFRRENAY